MKTLTMKEKTNTKGGQPIWQCYGSGHKSGMMIYGTAQLNKHYKTSNWIKHNPNYCGNW